jgi:hypothetical protein
MIGGPGSHASRSEWSALRDYGVLRQHPTGDRLPAVPEGTAQDVGSAHYQSAVGQLVFGFLCACMAVTALLAALDVLERGKPPWLFPGALLVALVVNLYARATKLTVTADGGLYFRGVLRRRRRLPASRLRRVSVYSYHLVLAFSFRGGRRATLAWGPDGDWTGLRDQLARLNPEIRFSASRKLSNVRRRPSG